MRKNRWVFYGLAFCVSSATAQLERRLDRSYSLGPLNQQEFLQLLIQRSIEVQYSKIAADVSSHLMQSEAGLYEPNLFMNVRGEGRDRQRTADERIQNNTTASTAILDESGQSKELGIRGRLPWGTELSVSYKASEKSNNLIPQYNSAKFDTEFNTLLSVTIKQPLLRNSGRDVTETDLRVAELERDASLLQFRQQILKTSIEGLSDWRIQVRTATRFNEA